MVIYLSIKCNIPPAMRCQFHEEYASFMIGFGHKVLPMTAHLSR